jgi:hypothetical protein
MSGSARRRLKKLESRLPAPPPAPGADDPQLTDTLPLSIRLQMIKAQQRAVTERGSEELTEEDLPPSTWAVLREWDAARGKLNRALRQARRKAGIPAGTPHLARVRELPLPPDVRALLEKWEQMVSVSGD